MINYLNRRYYDKKDLTAIATIINNAMELQDDVANDIAIDIANYLAEKNPYFYRSKFLEDCGINPENNIEEIRE